MARIIIIDDDLNTCTLLSRLLSKEGHEVSAYQNPKNALESMDSAVTDLVITDISMPEMNGIEVLEEVRKTAPAIDVIMITAFASVESAVDALRKGAYDYVVKPFQNDDLLQSVGRVLEKRGLYEENIYLKAEISRRFGKSNIVGISDSMQEVFSKIEKVAESDATVSILGESGVGKELVAKAIHLSGSRKGKRFVALNCSALPENLLESEIFGHIKGAFTGALESKQGLFEYAGGGTLFLDEVGDTPVSVQSKLLRAIEDKKIRPVGDNREVGVDVRIITATSKDLKQLIADGAFREDLFYRINVIPLSIPPLRERREDIPVLLNHFLKKGKRICSGALDIMTSYSWPGNVRELENMVERILLFCNGPEIEVHDLPEELLKTVNLSFINESYADARKKAVDSFNISIIKSALKRSAGNVTRAARSLEMDRANFQRLLRKYSVDPSVFRDSAS